MGSEVISMSKILPADFETIDANRERWRVPGGWVVRIKNADNTYWLELISDPNHEWVISSETEAV